MTQTITVSGMSCEGCENAVKDALESVNGVTEAHVDRESGSATLDGEANMEEITNAVTDAGYEVGRNEN